MSGDDARLVRRLKAERMSRSKIARRLGIGRTLVRRTLAAS
ncbi:helix-turn-helix domain-containing protein [Singulisphaera acidiphila]|nr:helix-turn-helix domain-containing protein [Singulisphaera acidiphila]